MEAITLLKTQATGVRRDWASIVSDLTQEQAHWRPPGVANPIIGVLVHAIGFVDTIINKTAQGKPTIWETGNWAEKIPGLAPGRQDLEKARAAKTDVAVVKQYVDQVLAEADRYLGTITSADLDRQVPGFGGNMVPLANQLSSALVVHFAEHMGEMSGLKGSAGGKGYAG
ncbi:MAG: DinB family protein [Dehalococcoidia bacterium]|nr:DinB family protein [Dehalococcoidia bacterium]